MTIIEVVVDDFTVTYVTMTSSYDWLPTKTKGCHLLLIDFKKMIQVEFRLHNISWFDLL